SYTDPAGNLGGAGFDSGSTDRTTPTLSVNIVAGSLNDATNSSVVTFAFSEAPGASFTESDIQLSAGLTLNAGSLTLVDATHYQATVTAVDRISGAHPAAVPARTDTAPPRPLSGAAFPSAA